MALYEACDAVGLPILFHLDDIRNPDTPDLPRLENVLKAFPKLPLIGHLQIVSVMEAGSVPDQGRVDVGVQRAGELVEELMDDRRVQDGRENRLGPDRFADSRPR